jgi:hypothetical protein
MNELHFDFPKADELVDIELKLLRFITSTPLFQNNFDSFGELYKQCQNCLEKQPLANLKKRDSIDFNFNSHFSLVNVKNERTFFCIGAQIIGTKSQENGRKFYFNWQKVTYSLEVLKGHEVGNLKIEKKLHFDFQPYDSARIPIFHFQINGGKTEYLKELCLNPSSFPHTDNEPRFHSMPMNLSLMLALIFNDYSNDLTKRIIHRSDWTGVLKLTENKILLPFFTNCGQFLQNKKAGFIMNYLYGN